MSKDKTNQKGITLIALVITIIVMLILVGVSVTVALNGGLFSTAKEAAEGTASKRNEELELSSGKVEINGEWYNSIDEYVNGGSTNIPEEPENPTGYTAYSIGDEVTIGEEHFYVLKDSDETNPNVTLLAKDCIDTTTLVQSASAGTVAFSTEKYWEGGIAKKDIVEPEPILDEETGKLTLPASHVAAKAAYDYGRDLGGIGRLMTYNEATELQTTNSNILYGINGKSSSTSLSFWLGTSDEATPPVWNVLGNDLNNLVFTLRSYFTDDIYGVRPVVEISKSSIS